MSRPRAGEVTIASEGDIVLARRTVRDAATAAGFGMTDVTRIVTAASELARNVFHYAGTGRMRWMHLDEDSGPGIEIVFEDHGPGIADVDQALQPGFSTGGGLGLGLPGVKRLMDELVIDSAVGGGTRIAARKWLRR